MGNRAERWFNRQWICSLLILLFSGLSHAGTHHYYTDPQGAVLAKTDASGNIIATYDYAPYGTAITSMSPAPNGPGYTGHVNDLDTGLVYMQARCYDPSVGMFLTANLADSNPSTRFFCRTMISASHFSPAGVVVLSGHRCGGLQSIRSHKHGHT